MFNFISVLSVDVLIFLGFMFIIFKMVGSSYIDISKCRKRYFDNLDGSEDESESNSDNVYNNESDTTHSERSYYEDVIFTLYIELQQYFNIEENRTKLFDVLSNNSNNLIITNEVLEDLLNNKEFEYPIETNGVVEIFNVTREYTKMVDRYGEYHFNYNTSTNIIEIGERDGTIYYSSLGQLNFYKWFFENVYNYANARYT